MQKSQVGKDGLLVPLGPRLEKAMAPHSSTLAWKIPWTEEPGGLQPMDLKEPDMTEAT